MRYCCLLLILLFSVSSVANTTRAEKKSLLNKVSQQIENLTDKLQKDKSQLSSLQQEVKKLDLSIQRTSNALHQTQRALDLQNKQLNNLQAKQAVMKANLEKQQSTLAMQLRSAYKLGQHHYLKLLLNQQNPTKINRQLGYYKILSRARIGFMSELEDSLAELIHNEEQIKQSQAQLNILMAERQASQHTLTAKISARNLVIAKLNTRIHQGDRKLQQLYTDQAALEKILKKIKTTKTVKSGANTAFKRLKGKLTWPVDGQIAKHFGALSQPGLKSSGVFINAHEGENIKAIYPGKVVFADWLRGMGLILIIEHSDGYMSLYGHNQNLYKQTGDSVEAGEVIARVGRSGGQNQPGLYFEIRHKGRPENPERWLA